MLAGILDFFVQPKMIKALNHTFLTMIPKKGLTLTLNDYQPISCISVTYKIISKMLATHLAVTLPHLLSPNQCPFLRGRRISDNIILSQE